MIASSTDRAEYLTVMMMPPAGGYLTGRSGEQRSSAVDGFYMLRFLPARGSPALHNYASAPTNRTPASAASRVTSDGDQLSLIIQARMSSSRRFVSWLSRRTAGSW